MRPDPATLPGKQRADPTVTDLSRTIWLSGQLAYGRERREGSTHQQNYGWARARLDFCTCTFEHSCTVHIAFSVKMEKLSLSALRQQLFKVVDRVIETEG